MSWRGEYDRHSLASRGIRTITSLNKLDSPIVGLSHKDIVEEFDYRNYPVVVVDSWDFWATWVHDEDIILFDVDSYSKLSPLTIQFMLDHEIEEMSLSKGDNEWNDRWHSWYVKKYHKEANKSIAHKYNPADIELIKKDLYKLAISQNPDKSDDEIVDMVEWTTTGLDIYKDERIYEVAK